MGARYLRASLQAPFCSEAKIAARLDLVEQLVTDRKVAMEIASTLRHMPDLSRLLGRLSTLSIKPGELGRMRQSLDAVANLAGVIANTSRPLASFSKQLQGVGKVRQILQQALVESPASLAESGDGIFIQGYEKEYDKLLSLKLDGGARITDYETKLKGETGIASLKIKEHKSYGLLIEVTKTNTKKVPTSFIRRQTMVNCERFVTEELRDLESKLTNAQAGAVQRESELWQKLLNTVKAHIETMSLAAELVAEIDCLANLALIAAEFNYVRPKTLKNTNAHRIHLTGARHPVVEMAVGRHAYVPNGFHLDSEVSAALITGPNMGGKSTFMRQTALIALLHQIGSFVPALSAELPIFDQIFTRIGAGDDLANNQSTFMVEMLEAAFILRNATASSLVILDEVGRGTSTTDGLAIAESILHDLLGRVGCTTLFATHFHELTDRFDQRVQRLQAEVIEKGQEIRFSHRIIPGSASRSFGIEVAKLAGIPTQVVKHAQRLAKGLEQAPLESLGLVAATDHVQEPSVSPVVSRLMALDIATTTPVQALVLLHELQQLAPTPHDRSVTSAAVAEQN
jgi:DNA mismatch repair protein MutS